MRSGRPKSDQTQPARQSRARSNSTAAAGLATAGDTDTSDTTTKAGRPRKSSDPTAPRATRKRSLLSAITADPRLTTADKKKITEAHEDGLTVQDLAALCVYELRLAQRLFEAGELAAKDVVVAIGKMTSHVAAAAQLGAAVGGSSGASISITFDAGSAPSSDRPEGQPRTPTDPQIGDIIEAE